MPRIPMNTRPAGVASLLRHITAIVLFVIAAGCSGGGCGSGCSSCGGFTPLANGFDPTHRIENAGSARVTPAGLAFIQSNLGTLAQGILGSTSKGGIINFAVPPTSPSPVSCLFDNININVCPNGANTTSNPQICNAQINIGKANLTITPTSPYDLKITGTVPLLVQDIQITLSGCLLNSTVDVAIDGDGSCTGNAGAYDGIPLAVDIAVHVDTNAAHTARLGYSQLTVNQIVNDTDLTNNLDANMHICGGTLGNILNVGFIKNLVIGQLEPQLKSTLTAQVDNALCQKAAAGVPCPMGTTPAGSMICRYADNTCASTLLGTDGHIDLGQLLQSISAGTKGGVDLLFAAGGQDMNPNATGLMWGDLDPVKGGVTIGLFGGAEPNPLTKCAPLAQLQLPTNIPIPDELALGTGDTIPNWPATVPGPHLGIAVNERFANYALGGMYNSGVLCIGISTETIPLLSSSTLGLIAPSAKDLALQHEPQQVAVVLRPSNPPTVKFGNGTDIKTDPNLRVGLKGLALDFYIFSLDRFIRFMTATFDLDVPVNLTVSSAGLTPVISTINVSNGVVTNTQLLSDKPSDLASALGGLLMSVVGQQLANTLKPINLNSALASLGLQLVIPDTVAGKGSPGLVKLTKGTDNYLGIFAAFALAPMGPHKGPLNHTDVQVTRKTIDPEGLQFKTLRPDNMPVVELYAESVLDDGTRQVEYQYKVDDGFWHPYEASRYLTVKDDWLRVQARHTIYVRSHVVGDLDSLDEVPAEATVIIDAEPPKVTIATLDDGTLAIDAKDRLTPDPMVRYRFGKGDWSAWTPASRLGAIPPSVAATLTVEARDNEGNVGTATSAEVRGRYDGTAAACGCTAAGDAPARGGHALFLLGIALAGLGARSRLRRMVAKAGRVANKTAPAAAAIVVASAWAGCSCNSNAQHNASGAGGGSGTTTSSSSGSGTSSSSGSPLTELQPGLIGEYTSAAISGTTIWVAGYSEADWDNGNSYGDLVVGTWDGMKVGWKQVDGVPTTPPVDPTQFDVNGFRGGQTAPGDDVGLWTSIAIGGDRNPAVAYYDRTNHALKFAQYNGTTWAVQQVDAVMNGEVGRYAKMIFQGGNFIIAYQSIAPGGMNGALISKVRLATSMGGTPASGTWTFEDVAVVNTSPCRARFCDMTQACLSTTKQCTTTLDPSKCTGGCTSSQACVNQNGPTCVAIWDTSKIDAYPDAIGDYITMAPNGSSGVGIAYYDRTNGNLIIASKANGKWTTMIVDGESAATPSGDSGIGASLVIDGSGDWNLTYVNGYSEALQYVKVSKGTTVGKPEVVDDGLGVAGTPFTDGQHLVGDDSHLAVDPGGVVHVSYQDATAGALHYAVGQPGSTGHMWQVKTVTQQEFAGAFSGILTVNNQLQVMNWWRVGGASVNGDVRILAP